MTKASTSAKKPPIEEVPTRDLVDSIRAELEYEKQKAEREDAEREHKKKQKR